MSYKRMVDKNDYRSASGKEKKFWSGYLILDSHTQRHTYKEVHLDSVKIKESYSQPLMSIIVAGFT